MTASEVAAWWGAGTGTVSVILTGARFVWDRGASKRALRDDLRAMASEAKSELSEARAKASVGSNPGSVGAATKRCTGDAGLQQTAERVLGVNRNPNVLMLPLRRKLWVAAQAASLAVMAAEHAWETVARYERFPEAADPHQRTVSTAEFLREADPAIEKCNELIRVLTQLER